MCIFVVEGLPYSIIPLFRELEATAIQIHLPNMKISICSLYIPSDFPRKKFVERFDDLIANIPCPFILTMDSNVHHSNWGSEFSVGRGRDIDLWMENNNLVLLNTGEPTYMHPNGSLTHINLTVVSTELALGLQWEPHTDNFCSDHFPMGIISSFTSTSNISKTLEIETANWTEYHGAINLPDVESFVSPTQA